MSQKSQGRSRGRFAHGMRAFAAVALICAALGAGVLMLSRAFDMAWLLPASMLVLAAISLAVYAWSLDTLDKTLAENRDTLSEVLCKAG